MDETQGTRTHPKVAAVASLNWPSKHDAVSEPLPKCLKANIQAASSHVYPLNLPTRFREDPLNLAIPLLDVWLPAAGVFCLLLSFPAAMSSAASGVRDRALFGFSCAMLFAGLFFYYQGRSYTSNLVAFAFPLVCAGFSWLWTDSGTQSDAFTPVLARNNVPMLAFAIASAALIASPFTAAPFMNPLSSTLSDEDRALREFIRKESKQHDTAFIVSPQAWRLHLLSGVPPPIRIPPQSGLLTRLNEQDTLAAASPGSAHALFVDPQYFSPEVQLGSPFAQIFLARIVSGWQHEKTLKLKSGELAVMTPRTGPRGTVAPRAGAHAACQAVLQQYEFRQQGSHCRTQGT